MDPALHVSARFFIALGLAVPASAILSVTLLPLFWMWMIPASIGGTELAPLFLLVGLLVIGLAWRPQAGKRTARWWALGLGAGIIVVAGRTVVQVPAAWADADAALEYGLAGTGVSAAAPAFHRACDPLALFIGLHTPPITIDTAVELGDSEGVQLLGDVYHPPQPGPHPIVLVLHGGGWSSGSRSEGQTASRALAAAGFLVVASDYRLAPAHHFPAQLADVQIALRWIRAHATALGGDPTRIALLGRSAGAQLALLTAANPQSGVVAVIGFYSPVDFTAGWLDPGWPDPLHARSIFSDYFGGGLAELPEQYREASPINHTDHPLPPTLLIYGRADQLVHLRFGQALVDRLRAGGTPTVFITIPWAEHAFDAIPHGLGGQLALHQVELFLNATLRR